LAREGSFEEVIYLLWEGQLPTQEQLKRFTDAMAADREIDAATRDTLKALAATDETPMVALRTAVLTLSASDPEPDVDSEDLTAAQRKGRRITAKLPTILAIYDRFRRDESPVDPRTDLSHAANFLYMLTGEEPDSVATETFDMALTLHADHGFNASTFTTLVIASTLADMYAAVTGGVGALSGPLHGGADQDVMEALFELDDSNMDPIEWVKHKSAAGERVPGWGHGVYTTKDPRAMILQSKLEDLTAADGDTKWLEYTTSIEEHLTEEKNLPEKGIALNVDFYSGSVCYKLGIPIDMYTPIFAISRVGGWVGHILEYTDVNRLIRPRGRYVGPTDQSFTPIDQR